MQHHREMIIGLGGLALFTQTWRPDRAPRGIVLLVHGVGEHSGRYEHVAAYLVERGYAVFALDHRGHGRSEGRRVSIRRFDEYVVDLRLYFEHIRARDPEPPVFLYGHSMGSIIALRFALLYQSELAGLITTGTALNPHLPVPRAVIPVARLLARVAGAVKVIPPIVLEGLSRDPAVIAAYRTDPLVYYGRLRLGWSAELYRAVREVNRLLPALHLPCLVLHGADDPIALPAGAGAVRARAGSADLTVRVYPGLRHEIHNEPEHAQVLGDIAAWLDAHIAAPQVEDGRASLA